MTANHTPELNPLRRVFYCPPPTYLEPCHRLSAGESTTFRDPLPVPAEPPPRYLMFSDDKKRQLALFRVPPPIKVNRLIFNAETRSERLGAVCVQAGAWAMFFTNNHIKFDIGIILVYIRIYLLGSPDGCFVVREHGCAEIET